MRALATLTRPRNLLIGAGFVAILTALGIGQAALDQSVAAAQGAGKQAPRFEVDPFWPKPLPNHWILGSTIGVWVDADDHVWVIHRSSATLANNEKPLENGQGECCRGAPPVLEFDQAGNLLRSWGGPGEGYEWPNSNHGIFIDHKGFVWIGGNGPANSHILKFTKDGRFVMQVGKKGARRRAGAAAGEGEGAVANFSGGSNDQVSFGRVAKIFVDAQANEAYVADGYLNKRVAVLDADTGKMKRFGAPTATGPTTRRSRLTIRRRRRRSSSAIRCTAPTCRSIACSMLRSRQQPAPGLHARRQVRQGSVLREEHEERGLGLGCHVLARCAAALRLHRRWREREGQDHRSRDDGRDRHVRRRRPSTRTSTACTASPPTARATCPPRPTRVSGC